MIGYPVIYNLIVDMMILVAGIVFIFHYTHRKSFWWRVVPCLVIGLGSSLLLSWLEWSWLSGVENVFFQLLRIQLFFLLVILQNVVCTSVRTNIAIYSGIWSVLIVQVTCESWRMGMLFLGGTGIGSLGLLLGCLVVVLAICWCTLIRWLSEKGVAEVGPKKLTLAILQFSLSEILYIYFIFVLQMQTDISVTFALIILVIQLYGMTILFFENVLFQKSALKQELMTYEMMFQQSKSHYELSKENIALLNQKCHDMKHQLQALRMQDSNHKEAYATELENTIRIYSAFIKTGNEALDTILTEKSLYCEAHEIQIHCVVDGKQLSFINPVDLYALFGNALSNAIECVEAIEDRSERVIDVTVCKKQHFLVINITNPNDKIVEMKDGLPVTTKQMEIGYHGFGMKSIKYTANKYGGTVTIDTSNQSFSLRILFPVH